MHVTVLIADGFDVGNTAVQFLDIFQYIHHLTADGHFTAPGNVKVGLHAVHVAGVYILKTGHAHGGKHGLWIQDGVFVHLHIEQIGRPQAAKDIHCRVIHHQAVWLVVGFTQKAAIVGIGRAGSHAGHFERQAVDHGHVSALVDDHHRMPGRDWIEIVLGWVSAAKGHPARTDHPFTLWGDGDPLGEFGLHLLDGEHLRLGHVHIDGAEQSAGAQVAVGVDQAGGGGALH